MERCPNCRARYRDGEACRRCGMELGHLLAAEAAAERLLRQGVANLADGDVPAALGALQRAASLAHNPFAELLLGFARHQGAIAGERQTTEGTCRSAATALPKKSSTGPVGFRPTGLLDE